VINEALTLLRAWYTDGVHGIGAKLALVPRLAGDGAVSMAVEVHTEIDLTDQGRSLAVGRVPVPALQAGPGSAGKVFVALSLARPGFVIDPKLLPPVRDDQVPILHLFARRTSDAARGTRDLGYAFRAALWSSRELEDPLYTDSHRLLVNNCGLVAIEQYIIIPAYQAAEDVEVLMGFITVWTVRDIKPTGV
jgi:hypothetical protein